LLDDEHHDIQTDLQQAFGTMWIRTGPDQGFEIQFGKWIKWSIEPGRLTLRGIDQTGPMSGPQAQILERQFT
jgi:hypothetical protein